MQTQFMIFNFIRIKKKERSLIIVVLSRFVFYIVPYVV